MEFSSLDSPILSMNVFVASGLGSMVSMLLVMTLVRTLLMFGRTI